MMYKLAGKKSSNLDQPKVIFIWTKILKKIVSLNKNDSASDEMRFFFTRFLKFFLLIIKK